MFKYFPTNYVWNLSVDLAIEMGARIGEIEEMCAPLQEAAKKKDKEGTEAFRNTWANMADKLCVLAEEDEQAGRMISAGEKYMRASSYLITCERLQAHNAPGRLELYKRELELFERGMALKGANCKRVEIPYEGKHLSGLYVKAKNVDGPAPLLIQVNGLDSTKEMKYLVGLPQWLAERGVSSLVLRVVSLPLLSCARVSIACISDTIAASEPPAEIKSRRLKSCRVSFMDKGPRSVLGVTFPARNEPNQNAGPTAWLVYFGDNGDVKFPHRFPILPETHEVVIFDVKS